MHTSISTLESKSIGAIRKFRHEFFTCPNDVKIYRTNVDPKDSHVLKSGTNWKNSGNGRNWS